MLQVASPFYYYYFFYFCFIFYFYEQYKEYTILFSHTELYHAVELSGLVLVSLSQAPYSP